MHPVVKTYVEGCRLGPSPELLKCARSLRRTGSPAVRAVEALCAAGSDGKRFERARTLAAKAATLRRDAPDLLVLAYCLWGHVGYQTLRRDEHDSAFRAAEALVTETTPTELKARIEYGKALMARNRGAWREADRITSGAIKSLAPGSAFRKRLVVAVLPWQAIEGTAREAIAKAASLAAEPVFETEVAFAQLVHQTETGELDGTSELLATLRADSDFVSYAGIHLEAREAIVDIMRGDTPRTRPLWVESTVLLLEGHSLAALEAARKSINNSEDIPAGFPTNFLIRAELAAGNAGAALRLLATRRARGQAHYLDDFHFARADLQLGNRLAAAWHFGRILAGVDRYNARGRLNLEMRLACEVDPLAFVEMAVEAGKVTAVETPATMHAHEAGAVGDLHGQDGGPEAANGVIGSSPAAKAIRESVAMLAPLSVPVLITGETGTGKDLVARALHETGPRSADPFIAVNCSAISEHLLQTELFGHERGAFTGADSKHRGLFEEAAKGTLFLDEIGDMAPSLQAALLRVLETGEIRRVGATRIRKVVCRIVAATNADLDELVRLGRLRKDLFYRFRRMVVRLAPLRHRREDIIQLAQHFLCEGRADGDQPVMSRMLREALVKHDWPGNVRELRSLVEQMRILNSDGLHYDIGLLDASFGRSGGANTAAGQVAREASGRGEPGEAGDRPLPANGEGHPAISASRTPHRRRGRLRTLFRQHTTLHRREVIDMLGVSHSTATKDLRSLCEEGFIEKVMPNRSPRTHYFRVREDRPTG